MAHALTLPIALCLQERAMQYIWEGFGPYESSSHVMAHTLGENRSVSLCGPRRDRAG
jgi:hypothetical protein